MATVVVVIMAGSTGAAEGEQSSDVGIAAAAATVGRGASRRERSRLLDDLGIDMMRFPVDVDGTRLSSSLRMCKKDEDS